MRVNLRKVEAFGRGRGGSGRGAGGACATGPARFHVDDVSANEHLANCMQRHLHDEWMGTPGASPTGCLLPFGAPCCAAFQ